MREKNQQYKWLRTHKLILLSDSIVFCFYTLKYSFYSNLDRIHLCFNVGEYKKKQVSLKTVMNFF